MLGTRPWLDLSIEVILCPPSTSSENWAVGMWGKETSALCWVSQPNIYQKKGARAQVNIVFCCPNNAMLHGLPNTSPSGRLEPAPTKAGGTGLGTVWEPGRGPCALERLWDAGVLALEHLCSRFHCLWKAQVHPEDG